MICLALFGLAFWSGGGLFLALVLSISAGGLIELVTILRHKHVGAATINDILHERVVFPLGVCLLWLGAGIALALLYLLARPWAALPIIIAVTYDVLAFAVGKWAGKHIVDPALSPTKTWEGTLFGLVAAAVVGRLYWTVYVHDQPYNFTLLATFVSAAVGACYGDFFCSWLKRQANIKDSGEVITRWLHRQLPWSRACHFRWEIPGHGGILDRCASQALAIIVIFLIFVSRVLNQ